MRARPGAGLDARAGPLLVARSRALKEMVIMRSLFPRWPALLVAGLVTLGLAGSSRAQEEKVGPDLKAFNKQVAEVLRDIHNRGADLHNREQPEASFFLFQGALRAIAPLLGPEPEVQKAIKDGLDRGEVRR